MKRTTTYRWAAVTAAAAAGLAVLTAALAVPSSTTAPAAGAPTSQPTGSPWSSPASGGRSSWGSRDRSRDRSRDDGSVADAAAKAALPTGVSTRPRPMSSAFDAVVNRSIFVKGNQTIGGRGRNEGSGPVYPPPVIDPRASLVFRGFTQVGDGTDAMIEDQMANKIFTVRPGELLAGGRITAITFDDLDYTYGGRVTKVSIGENLDGQMAAAGSNDPPTTAPSPGTPVDTAPALGTTAGLSAEDILAKMKKRRQMEMGGK